MHEAGKVACATKISDPMRSNSITENLKNAHSIFEIKNSPFVGFWYQMGKRPFWLLVFVLIFLIDCFFVLSYSVNSSISIKGLLAFLSLLSFGKL